MFNKITNQAIQAALNNNWDTAIKYNLQILKINPNDIETILRLATAYQKSGQIKQAKKTYNQVLKIDRFNPIAKRNLAKLKFVKGLKRKKENSLIKDFDLFLEEPGKTKTISLIKLTNNNALLSLDNAEELDLKAKKNIISVYNKQSHYLGKIPEDISFRLIKLIKRGNKYLTVVKSVEKNKVQIFVKEILQSKRNKNISSFPSSKEQYNTFLSHEIINKNA